MDTKDGWHEDIKTALDALTTMNASANSQARERVGTEGFAMRQAAERLAGVINEAIAARLKVGAK